MPWISNGYPVLPQSTLKTGFHIGIYLLSGLEATIDWDSTGSQLVACLPASYRGI